MRTDSIAFAARAKGWFALSKRACSVISRYGLTPAKMNRALHLFAEILSCFDCGASFPLTAVTLKRNSAMIASYLDRNIEFAVHGYTHIDYSQLAPEEQLAHLRRAREVFAAAGIKAIGFRSPYLYRDTHLYAALEAAGFSYSSNQPVLWDVLDAEDLALPAHAGYKRAIAFYNPWFASERPSLPRLYHQLVEIPVSLPDDEILLDRLGGQANGLIERVWQRILSETYHLGELFTLQLHPERIALCEGALRAVLSRACSLPVWIARLDAIAAWWRSRTEAMVQVAKETDNAFRLTVHGPPGMTILARSVAVEAPTEPWTNGYQRVLSNSFVFQASKLPFIGLSPDVPSTLISFLQQQGYLVKTDTDAQSCAFYLSQTDFTPEDERPLLTQIEKETWPSLRLARWPDGAQSALAVTGDIDALRLWDYGLRVFGG
jgi:peptidoglycan/xylan/chitin deacetylase (PgdA/CDA1 family)